MIMLIGERIYQYMAEKNISPYKLVLGVENSKMKEYKNHILSTTIILLLSILEMLVGFQLWQLDVLPMKHLLLIAAVALLLNLLVARCLSFNKKKSKRKKIWRHRALGYFLSVLIVFGLLMVSQAISKVQETMDEVTETSKVSAVVELYVPKEDAACGIEDALEYVIAVTDSYDWDNTQSALADIEKNKENSVRVKNYANAFAMADALFAEEVDALLINSAYVDILTEMEIYADFTERVKCIWEYNVQQSVESETLEVKSQEETIEKESVLEPFVVYISGSDTRSKTLKTSRSDVNILAVVNPKTEHILLVNTPRDYYIGNPAGNGALDKLTHCGIYGIECSMEALSNLYDVEIDYYGQINFTGFEKLIDAIGGVDVYSEQSFTTLHGKHRIQAGENHLNGSQALGFARERYSMAGGDNGRGSNQMKVIKAVIDQISAGNIITNYTDIMDSLKGMFRTNIPGEKISSLVKLQLSEKIHWNVETYAVTGTGDSARTYSIPGANAYVMRPNQETVDQAKEMIKNCHHQ